MNRMHLSASSLSAYIECYAWSKHFPRHKQIHSANNSRLPYPLPHYHLRRVQTSFILLSFLPTNVFPLVLVPGSPFYLIYCFSIIVFLYRLLLPSPTHPPLYSHASLFLQLVSFPLLSRHTSSRSPITLVSRSARITVVFVVCFGCINTISLNQKRFRSDS
jgi:hypothetical protein